MKNEINRAIVAKNNEYLAERIGASSKKYSLLIIHF